jgi:hypothetical protein
MIEQDPTAKNQQNPSNQPPDTSGVAGGPDGETSNRCKTEGQRKERDWYDGITLGIAVLGLFGLWYYAYWAKVQAIATNNSVTQQILSIRPVLYHNGVDWVEKPSNGLIPSTAKVKVRWKNFGSSLAVRAISAGHIYVRPSEQKAPIDPACDENIPVADGETVGAVAPNEAGEPKLGFAPDQNTDEMDGKVLYVSGCIYYWGIDGRQRYFSDLCVKWEPNAPQDFDTCDETERNYPH